MRNCRFLVIGFALSFFSSWGQSPTRPAPKYFVNYGPEVNKSGEIVYSIAADKNGILYFAVAKGVLVYDGQSWETFSLAGQGDARSVEYDSYRDRILIGGVGTFGYLQHDPVDRFKFIPLSGDVSREHSFKQVWLINVQKDYTVFQTHEGFFFERSSGIEFKPFLDTYQYQIDDTEYYSTRRGGLVVTRGRDTLLTWDQKEALNESAFNVLRLPNNNHLIVYPHGGAYIMDNASNKLKPYGKLDSLIRKKTLYCSIMLSDSVIAFGTYSDGIVIANLDGSVIEIFDREKGLTTNGFYDLNVDAYGKIWGASEYGISVIDIPNALPNVKFYPTDKGHTVFTRFSVEDSMSYIFENEPIKLSKVPERLMINFAMPAIEYFSDHQYTTFLEGYDEKWSDPDEPNFRSIEEPGNGTYTLHVKGVTKTFSSRETSIKIIIDEPWYIPFIDIAIYAITGLGAFGLILFGYTYRLRHNEKRLMQLVAEKTKEIESRERELITINKSLRETNEELDTFLYRSSHDLVSPVKSIKGLVKLMRLSKDEYELYVNLMDDRITRLESILQEINSYVKNAKRDSVKTTIELREMVTATWASLEFLDHARGISFEASIAEDFTISSDREQWRMIVSNLLSNAIKYHDVRKRNPFIRVSVSSGNGFTKFTIRDNGQGIRKEHQEKLFDMFFRANEGSDGTGLGLFLVRKMVDKLGGTIELSSVYGEGTEVAITIPA